MGFRDKMKKTLGRTTSEENTPTLGKASKDGVEVYKPGEAPKPKYRGNWNEEHHKKLHAFSFTDTFGRRKSSAGGDISPGGTRRSSLVGLGKAQKEKHHDPSNLGQMGENADGDDDPANATAVGKSRPRTADKDKVPADNTSAPEKDSDGENENGLAHQTTIINGHVDERQNDTPFTQDELTKALTATKIKDNEEGKGEAAQ